MSFPRYPEYKDSGVEWLGEVPRWWNMKRLRFVGQLNPSKSETANLPRDTEVSFLPMEAVGDDGSLVLNRTRPLCEVESGYTYFCDGDVTVAKITPCFENGKGAVMRGLLGGIGFGTTELTVVRPHPERCSSEYLHWLFMSAPFRKLGEASMYGAGGQKRVPDDFIRDFAIAFPDRAEQTAIAAFLDRETGKIDALVAEQEKLIALLKEKRQAVISHAVAKGLNPNAPIKPSGIEWLGDVPAHWEVIALGRITVDKCDGPFGSGLKSEHYVEAGARVIRLQNIKGGYFDDRDAAFIDFDYFETEMTGHDVRGCDVLIAGLGDDKNTVGRACVAPAGIEPGMVKADCFRFRLMADRAYSEFVAWALTVGSVFDAGTLSSGSTRSRIPLSDMASRKIPLPDLREQGDVSRFVAERNREFDSLMSEANRAITLLKERRSALISAAVTGRIDVRGLLSQSPVAAGADPCAVIAE